MSVQIKWTDPIGVVHIIEDGELIIRELFERWPGGLDEIEASIEGWKDAARKQSACTLNLTATLMSLHSQCVEQLAGITDTNATEFVNQLKQQIAQSIIQPTR